MMKGNFLPTGSVNFTSCFYQVNPAQTKQDLHHILPVFY